VRDPAPGSNLIYRHDQRRRPAGLVGGTCRIKRSAQGRQGACLREGTGDSRGSRQRSDRGGVRLHPETGTAVLLDDGELPCAAGIRGVYLECRD